MYMYANKFTDKNLPTYKTHRKAKTNRPPTLLDKFFKVPSQTQDKNSSSGSEDESAEDPKDSNDPEGNIIPESSQKSDSDSSDDKIVPQNRKEMEDNIIEAS